MSSEQATTDDLRRLLPRACDELRRRLRAGEDCRAEQFLHLYPRLAADADSALELVRAEWQTRQELGRQLAADEWFARFPQWTDGLRRLGVGAPARETSEGAATMPETRVLPPATVPTPEQSLDHYELLEQIGRGGMGVVWKAWDPVLKRHVALKKIRSGALADDAEVRRFYREARAAAQLRHPNLVPIYGMGQHHGEHCFTMPLVGGGSLAEHAARYSSDPRAAVAIIEKVARAVQHAHEAGIVHRDLKPANVLIDDRGEPLVSDFGLAKVSDAGADVTLPGQVMGTPAYMAPEQAAGRTWQIGPATDVWALGVILYELLAGRRPFVGEQTQDVLQQVLAAEPPPLHARPGLDRGLEVVVRRCLEKEPGSRYPSAGALADDLARWLRGESIRPEGTPHRSWRRLRWPVACVLTVALLVGTFLVFRKKTPPDETAAPTPGVLLDADGLHVKPQGLKRDGKLTVKGGVAQIDAQGLALVRLMEAAPWQRYEMQAWVMDASGESGAVGFFVALTTEDTGPAPEHWFAALVFSERRVLTPADVNKRKQAQAMLNVYRHRDDLPGALGFSYSGSASKDRAFPPATKAWRRLRLQVTPEMFRAYWDDDTAPFAHFDRAVQLKASRRLLASLPPVRKDVPRFPPTGALGLFCKQGSARFRDVTVRPLPDE